MSCSRTTRLWVPLLLAGAMMAGDGFATPSAAEWVQVCVRGTCKSVWFNGGPPNGNGTLFNGGTVFDGSNGYFFNGNRRLYDGYGGRFVNGNGTLFDGGDGLFYNGNGRLYDGYGFRSFNGNGRIYNGNGRRYFNGGNGRAFVNGANGFNGNGWRNGWHNKRHFGPVDECFPDPSIGEWRCTGRRWRTHSGPHRAPYRGARTDNALF